MYIILFFLGVLMFIPNSYEEVTLEDLSELGGLIALASPVAEFEWSADQRKSLAVIARQLQISYSELIAQAGSDSKREQSKRHEEVIIRYSKATVEIKKLVSEEQFLKLKQFEVQLRTDSLADTLFGVLKLREELKLTDSQVEVLQELRERNDERFREEVLKLRKRVVKYRALQREKILSELSKEQRELLEKAVGPERIEANQFTNWFLHPIGN